MTAETSDTPWIRERDAVVERMLAGGGRAGVADPALCSGKSGLELLQAMLRGELPFPPIAETLDFSLISVEAGKAVFQSTPQFKHYNPLGSVHGGWYAALLDSGVPPRGPPARCVPRRAWSTAVANWPRPKAVLSALTRGSTPTARQRVSCSKFQRAELFSQIPRRAGDPRAAQTPPGSRCSIRTD